MPDMNETRIMGIDYGKVRIGLALSDSLKMFAIAHKTILNNSSTFTEIEKIIKEIIAADPKAPLGALMGQAMASGGVRPGGR